MFFEIAKPFIIWLLDKKHHNENSAFFVIVFDCMQGKKEPICVWYIVYDSDKQRQPFSLSELDIMTISESVCCMIYVFYIHSF